MPAKPKSTTPQAGKTDPLTAFHFAIEIDGITAARFSDASGFDHQTKSIEYREVDAQGNIYINKVIGGTSFSDITVKRGITNDNELWSKWRQHVMDGDYDQARKKVTVIGYDPKGAIVSTFVLDRCWISKWKGPAFSAAGAGVAFEEITFTHEGITRQT